MHVKHVHVVKLSASGSESWCRNIYSDFGATCTAPHIKSSYIKTKHKHSNRWETIKDDFNQINWRLIQLAELLKAKFLNTSIVCYLI